MINRQRGSLLKNLFLFAIVGALGGVILLIADALINTASPPDPAPEAVAATATPPAVVMADDVALDVPLGEPPTPAPGTYDLNNAQIIIPAVAINAPIIQVYLGGSSWDVSALGLNVGHLQGTTWLTGMPGNIVLSGHVEMRDGRRGVFAELGNVEVGALVILQQNGEERRYQVTEIASVAPTDLDPVRPTTTERLTLITCDDYNFFSDAYATRTIIIAEPIG